MNTSGYPRHDGRIQRGDRCVFASIYTPCVHALNQAVAALVLLCVMQAVAIASPQDQTGPSEAQLMDKLQYAEVVVNRYIPNDSLLLRNDGISKGGSLAKYYLALARQNAGDVEGALDAFEDVA